MDQVKKKHVKPIKNAIVIHLRFEEKTLDELDKFCRKKNVSKNIVIHKAVKEYMQLGSEFNIKTDKVTAKTKQDYIRQAVEWYLNERKS